MRPHPDHRFHARVEENGAYIEVYTDQTLAAIALNRRQLWPQADVDAASDILAYRLDYHPHYLAEIHPTWRG